MGQLCPGSGQHLATSARAAIAAALTLLPACVATDEPVALGEHRAAVAGGGGGGGGPDFVADPRRSLVVTELPILERFPLERVLDQLVAQSGVPDLTALELFHQWWDTQNLAPGLYPGPHCGDEVDDHQQPALNTFPYTCRAEGAQATVDPFADPGTNPDEYVPIGLFNRFDLTPSDASNCGEYRIVYGKRSGQTITTERNLVIFEMALANPHPQQGLKGCRKIATFWADLTAEDDLEARADALEAFYFDGIPSVPPVVHVDHLGGGPTGAGQVRTNQFLQTDASPRVWSLREFKLLRTCAEGACTKFEMVPQTVKGNPFGGLFDPTSVHPRAAALRDALIEQVPALAGAELTKIDQDLPDTFNTGQAQANGSENNYLAQLGTSASPLRTSLQAKLTAIGSTLTPDDIVARAMTTTCAGCHRLSNSAPLGGGLTWPSALGFVHVSDRELEVVDGVPRWRISDALVNAFLPVRKQVLEDYINDKLVKPPKPKDTLGGKRVH